MCISLVSLVWLSFPVLLRYLGGLGSDNFTSSRSQNEGNPHSKNHAQETLSTSGLDVHRAILDFNPDAIIGRYRRGPRDGTSIFCV